MAFAGKVTSLSGRSPIPIWSILVKSTVGLLSSLRSSELWSSIDARVAILVPQIPAQGLVGRNKIGIQQIPANFARICGLPECFWLEKWILAFHFFSGIPFYFEKISGNSAEKCLKIFQVVSMFMLFGDFFLLN